MASLELRKVRKAYGPIEVLHGVDLTISNGEFVALVGPSGCGKSTLLRMIAGLETVSSGDLVIDGRPMNNVPPQQRDIAMVFQSYALYPHMSVFNNMAFSLRLRKLAGAMVDERVAEASTVLGIEKLIQRYPRELSGGQRQRVAMGRAIVRSPKLFLFDEPLSNLDAKLRVQMRVEIKALHQRLGATSIYVTHDQIEAMTMADRVVVLDSGRIAQVGEPLELYDRPANLTVAAFIGSPTMNLIEGVGTTDGGINFPGIAETLRPEGGGDIGGRRVVYGVRPEHLDVAPAGPGLAAAVLVVEPTGAETVVVSEVSGTRFTSVISDRRRLVPGQPVWLRPRAGHHHLFDAISGERIEPRPDAAAPQPPISAMSKISKTTGGLT